MGSNFFCLSICSVSPRHEALTDIPESFIMQFFIICSDLVKMPGKFACYYITPILFLSFLLFSFMWRSLKTISWCFAWFSSSFVRAEGPHRAAAPRTGTGWEVSAHPSAAAAAEPRISRSLSPWAITPLSSAAKTSSLQLQPWSLLMVFLLFCLTCFCTSQQGLFVILMSSLCRYSSFASHEHFSTWVERFRDMFWNSVLAFHCGPVSFFFCFNSNKP